MIAVWVLVGLLAVLAGVLLWDCWRPLRALDDQPYEDDRPGDDGQFADWHVGLTHYRKHRDRQRRRNHRRAA